MRRFLILLVLSSLLAVGKSDIVLIHADDFGFGDLGCYGGEAIPTPHFLNRHAVPIRPAHRQVSVAELRKIGWQP